METSSILAVILARGGSKGIPKKNIYPICGHPLISYTIAAVLNCKMIDELVVSTDSKEIAEIALEYGAHVPFTRPEELADDTVFSRDALHHAVIESEKYFDKIYDYVVELPCVAPLRDHDDIGEALTKLIKTGADSVISVCQMQDKHPVRMKRISNDLLEDFCSEFPEGESSRRQDLEPCFIRNGAIYSVKREIIVKEYSRIGSISRPYIMPEEKSVNIDSITDLKLAEILIKEGKCNNRPVRKSSKISLEYCVKSNTCHVLISAPVHFLPELKQEMKNKMSCVFAYGVDREITKNLLKENTFEGWLVSPCPTYIIDKQMIDLCPSLKIIATPSTGKNHIDTDYAGSVGIKIFTLKDTEIVEEIYASSEFTFSLMISTIRKISQASQAVQSGIWRESEDLFRGRELNGMQLGIIGYGRIGKNLARYSRAFGMKILVYDPYVQIKNPEITQMNCLDTMLSESDVVVVCVHLNEKTYRMVNDRLFEKMKDGVYFINTSRGDVVDEDSLLRYLRNGKIQATGLDVISGEFTEEKYTHPLIKYSREHENLIITPHIAGLTFDSEGKAQMAAYEAIKNCLNIA